VALAQPVRRASGRVGDDDGGCAANEREYGGKRYACGEGFHHPSGDRGVNARLSCTGATAVSASPIAK